MKKAKRKVGYYVMKKGESLEDLLENAHSVTKPQARSEARQLNSLYRTQDYRAVKVTIEMEEVS